MSCEPPPILEHLAVVEHAGRDGRNDDPDVSRSFGLAAARAARPNERILVVVQLLGGNDGLNTVVPHGIDGYNRGRRALRLPAGQIHKITAGDRLAPLDGRDGQAARERAAGGRAGGGLSQPRPLALPIDGDLGNGRLENDAKALETGWLGRALDARPAKPGDDPPGLHVGGRSMPLALRARKTEVPVGREPRELQAPARRHGPRKASRAYAPSISWRGVERRGDDPLAGLHQPDHAVGLRVERPAGTARHESGRTARSTPNFGLARRLELIAQIIKADFGTRIFYTSLDGFDTHANQLGTHAALLNELSDSIAAFHDDLAAAGQGDRVALLTFSEFGRRVLENASQGTDHGAAAPVFLVGPVAQGRTRGQPPESRRSRRRRPEVSHRLPIAFTQLSSPTGWALPPTLS